MQPLSESLLDLANRFERLKDSAAAVREKNRAKLQARRDELEAAIDRARDQLQEATIQAKMRAKGAAHTWWSDTRSSIERQFAQMRAEFEKWQAEMKEKNAERAAKNAEEGAVMAVNLAAHRVDAAEWAVVRARLARDEADQLVKGV